MPVRNAHFYSINEGTAYPVDDAATGDADDGTPMPDNVITDLNLRWPLSLGRYAFLSSLSVTPTIVALTVLAADSPDGPAGFTPIAVLAVVKPIDQGRQYRLLAQADGVSGWAVFGSGASGGESYVGRFSTPGQSRLTARAARAYRELPVSGVRVSQADAALRGMILVKTLDPLRAYKEEREVNGVLRDCLVVRLVEGSGVDGFPVPGEAAQISGYREPSTFREFAGPCAGRPESHTCGDPQPIEFVNAVGPDCDGNITIEITGCAVVSQILGVCGVAIDCGLGLVDACLPAQIPSSEGFLPGEYEPANVPVPPDVVMQPPGAGDSESAVEVGGLPYAECFADGSADDFVTAAGAWSVVGDDSDAWKPCAGVSESLSVSGSVSESPAAYSYASITAASRGVTLWDGFDATTLSRRFSIDAKMSQGPAGAKRNAALVVNYRPHSVTPGLSVYYLAEIDYDAQQVRVSRFNGTTFQVAASHTVPGVRLERWHEIAVTVTPGFGTSVSLTAAFTSLEDSTVAVTIGPLSVSNFLPGTGLVGFGTDRAVSRFGYLRIEEV